MADQSKEIWKDISGYEGLYQISTLGRIKSLSKYVKHSVSGLRFCKEIIKILHNSIHGYPIVMLYKNGEGKTKTVHRLLALHFIQNPENKPEVNHIDGIKTNNVIENLEWCTRSENGLHAFKMGLNKQKKGKDHITSKQILQYTKDGCFINEYGSMKEAERCTGVYNGHISKVAKGKRKSAGGFIWKYKNN